MGKETLGRIINVIGEPVDEQGPVSAPLASLVHPMAPVMAAHTGRAAEAALCMQCKHGIP